MQYLEFMETVERVAAIPREDAERAARATLETLGERLSHGEANDLAEELPQELRAWIHSTGEAQPFGVEEFLDRIARREGIAPPAAERHARAVLAAVGKAISPGALKDVAPELPRDYGDLISAAGGGAEPGADARPVMPADEFARRVADGSGLDQPTARDVASVVLEMLGERITRGQVANLTPYLPAELQAALQRGSQRTAGNALRMSLQDFLDGIAEWEGAGRQEAKQRARAVLQALREAVPDKQFSDMLAQLPLDYRLELLGEA